MSQKKEGVIKKFESGSGILIDENKNKIEIYRKNFVGHPLRAGEKVCYIPTKRNGKLGAHEIESTYAYYFKQNVLELDKCDYDTFCDKCLEYARKLKKDTVTTSMIRKVYDLILQADSVMKLKQLRPQFAYIAGRNSRNSRIRELMHILDFLAKNAKADTEKYENSKTDKHLEFVQQFMEAIVAYLKFVGE